MPKCLDTSCDYLLRLNHLTVPNVHLLVGKFSLLQKPITNLKIEEALQINAILAATPGLEDKLPKLQKIFADSPQLVVALKKYFKRFVMLKQQFIESMAKCYKRITPEIMQKSLNAFSSVELKYQKKQIVFSKYVLSFFETMVFLSQTHLMDESIIEKFCSNTNNNPFLQENIQRPQPGRVLQLSEPPSFRRISYLSFLAYQRHLDENRNNVANKPIRTILLSFFNNAVKPKRDDTKQRVLENPLYNVTHK